MAEMWFCIEMCNYFILSFSMRSIPCGLVVWYRMSLIAFCLWNGSSGLFCKNKIGAFCYKSRSCAMGLFSFMFCWASWLIILYNHFDFSLLYIILNSFSLFLRAINPLGALWRCVSLLGSYDLLNAWIARIGTSVVLLLFASIMLISWID